MNKFERQSGYPAECHSLPGAIANELAEPPIQVMAIPDAPPIAPRAPLTQSEVRTILMSLLLIMFLAALDQTIVATALPTIGRQFKDVTNLSWVITAYLLASTAVAPVFGTLSDIYGRRGMIVTALSLFIVGSMLCAMASSMPVLILARGVQGLGGGGIMPVVQTVISDVVSPRERGQYQAYFSGVWMLAGLGTAFPVSVVAMQNAVARAQVGTITGAMNFFRSMLSSFTVAVFSAILLAALGADISLAEGAHGSVNAIEAVDMVAAFRYVFGAATIMVSCASLCMIAMEERPLAGPSHSPVEMAE